MIDNIQARRSCRSFDSSKPVPREVIDNILKAALNAPTGVDFQSYDYIVCTNKEKLAAVSKVVFDEVQRHESVKDLIKSPDYIFYGAPLVIFIVPSREFREDCYKYDLGIIGNSICLSAQLQGLSSVHVGFVQIAPAEELGKLINLPRNLSPLAVAIGYPNSDWVPHHKEITSTVKYIN